MDGITGSPTLGGVVLATISGAAYAVFKVCAVRCSMRIFRFLKLCFCIFAFFHVVKGDVSKGDWRSAGANDRVFIYNNRFNQFNTLLADTVGSVFKRYGGDAIRKYFLD